MTILKEHNGIPTMIISRRIDLIGFSLIDMLFNVGIKATSGGTLKCMGMIEIKISEVRCTFITGEQTIHRPV